VSVEDASLLELPPGETLADLVLGAEPPKCNVCSPFRFPLGGRKPLLRSLVPDKRLTCFDLAAELA
jgi:hypothetical protein